MTYAEKLKDPRWQRKRLEVLQRDDFTCQVCGDKKTTLHVHHSKYTGEPWEAPMDDLLTLCEHCHTYVPVEEIKREGITIRKVNIDGWGLVFIYSDGKSIEVYGKGVNDLEMTRRIGLRPAVVEAIYTLYKETIQPKEDKPL